MKKFMDRDYILETETARHLFFDYAEKLPIIDYHCHLSPKEIAEDMRYDNITQVWLGGDHYKWRQMRSNGIDEIYITGDASDYDKFIMYARTLEKAIGNPLYAWSHLELQRYFDYHGVLNSETAEEVWNLCNAKLRSPDMSARALITASNVDCLCTTDDPADDLHYHLQIQKEQEDSSCTFRTGVLPAWRPDRAVSIEKEDFADYIFLLSKAAELPIQNYEQLKEALIRRMDYFASVGCVVSDHGMDYIFCEKASEGEIQRIFSKALNGDPLTKHEILCYKTQLMLFLAREYKKRNWAMQLHFSVRRNNNTYMFRATGPDTGFDCIDNYSPISEMTGFLDDLASTGELPKTILYSLNPIDNAAIGSVIGCFQNSDAVGKIQHGAAWWFNDHKDGMEAQMRSLASLGLLGNFVGMLTDSRSFLSYPRHEYFRRIFCNLVGNWVENGEFPNDERMLKNIVQGVSYYNAKDYFGI